MSADCNIIQGDALTVLKTLPSDSVHCVVTSPPYWGLRDYGVEGQLGLERTPEEYVAKMVEVFREVRRVLREDGTCWVNMGDSYATSNPVGRRDCGAGELREGRSEPEGSFTVNARKWRAGAWKKGVIDERAQRNRNGVGPVDGLKAKDLCGIPWRLAFALQADGWVLRQEIVWSKPNAMPESVCDRCTKAHEQIFLFAKAKWRGPEPGMFSHISEQDARWLALLLDTEGNICVKRTERQQDHRTWYGTQIAWANTSRQLLETAKSIIGKGSIHERPGKNSPVFYYQVANQEARWLLYRLYPHFIIKARQAKLGIYLQELLSPTGKKRPNGYRSDEHTAILERAWATMKSLNHFGNPDISWVPEPKYGHWDSERYFFDAEAIKEETTDEEYRMCGHVRPGLSGHFLADPEKGRTKANIHNQPGGRTTRNKRTVWTIPSEPYPESHFATFPTALVKPCILAGTSARGCCPKCGAPWERVVEADGRIQSGGTTERTKGRGIGHGNGYNSMLIDGAVTVYKTTGWRPTCSCGLTDTVPCTVFDPFFGSGTVGQVALELGRRCIGIELNPAYVELARKRTNVTPGLQLA